MHRKTYMRYKYKIGDMVMVDIPGAHNAEYNNRVAIIIEREHTTSRAGYNDYKLVVCGKPDNPIWFSEPYIRKFE